MLRLECPWCGTRDELEFSFGGEAHIVRPAADVSDAVWADYLFNRENPRVFTLSVGGTRMVAVAGLTLDATRLLMKFTPFMRWGRQSRF